MAGTLAIEDKKGFYNLTCEDKKYVLRRTFCRWEVVLERE